MEGDDFIKKALWESLSDKVKLLNEVVAPVHSDSYSSTCHLGSNHFQYLSTRW